MTDDKQHDVTTELNEALAAGFAAGDFEGVGAFYTEDTRLLPPRGKVLDGRASIGGFWLGFANRFSAMTFSTVDLRTLADTVRRETGTYVITPAEGTAEGRPGIQGKYVFVWLLVDGEWQIESSIWNRSDAGGGRQQGQGQGQGRGQGGGQGQRAGQGGGAGPGGQSGGYRRGPGGGQGGGQRQAGGPGGGYRQGSGRPSFQGGGGGAGGPRRGGQGQAGSGYGGGGTAGGAYDADGGLYSNPKG
ncbi:MAG: YybH family protein [Janthinobacterium lividum]